MNARWRTGSLVLLLAGGAALGAGFLIDPRRALFAHLTAWSFVVTTLVGLLVLLMITHAAQAVWFTALRRLAEIGAFALPALILLALPIVLGAAELDPWAGSLDAFTAEERELLHHKRVWLSLPFFGARTLVWLGAWSIFAWLLASWSLRQDREPHTHELHARMRRLSAGALPVMAFTITFASFDWMMSLEPLWLSTVYGIYVFSSGFVAALALLGVAAARPFPQVTAQHRYALGKLLFAMVIFWAYIAFVQLLVVWIANVPHEVAFYRRRIADGWLAVAIALGLAHFALPFLALLSRDRKRNRRALAAICAWLLAAHYLHLYWLILPVYGPPAPHWLDLAALAANAGAVGLVGALRYRDRPLFAVGDPSYEQSLGYRGT